MSVKGVDVSEWQEHINWEKVKKAGIKFAILRCGIGMDYTSQDDLYFLKNVSECERLGIPYGVYLFSYANTVEKAKSEARHTLRLIKDHKPKLGVWYDVEDYQTSGRVSKETLTNIINTYCNTIKNEGYYVGVYASLSWLNTKIEKQIKNKFPIWVAQYYSKCEYTGNYVLWQYASDGKVDGINGRCDLNYLYDESLLTGTNNNVVKPAAKETEKDRIKKLQTALNKDFKSGLKIDGIIGTSTTKIVKNHYLKYYTIGEFVKWTQTQLKRKGYSVGTSGIDGKYGKSTESAVKKYQKAKKLTVDGCVGIEMVKSLVK